MVLETTAERVAGTMTFVHSPIRLVKAATKAPPPGSGEAVTVQVSSVGASGAASKVITPSCRSTG